MFKHSAKTSLSLAVILVLVLSAVSGVRADDRLQGRVETLAAGVTFFATHEFIYDRSLEFALPPQAAEHERTVGELRTMKDDRAGLVELLAHGDPKVRTLALGALFLREDGRDLPLLAALIGNAAPTFPDLRRLSGAAIGVHGLDWDSGGGKRAEIKAQSVGDVARAMIGLYLRAAGFGDHEQQMSERFAIYWKPRAGRQHCASWFAVKLLRASRGTSPMPQTRRPQIERVLQEMDGLPQIERAWTRLWVLSPALGMGRAPAFDEAALVATARELGPERLLRFLQRKDAVPDPDFDEDRAFSASGPGIAHFLLRHAREVFRPGDADALLACAEAERKARRREPLHTPWWAIAPADLQPARAGTILRAALGRLREHEKWDGALLAGALWRLRGTAEKEFLVEWFYTGGQDRSTNPPAAARFLEEVQAAARAETRELLAALVAHPRLELTDWQSTSRLLTLARGVRPAPLVSEQEVMRAEHSPDRPRQLGEWWNLLRREFKVAETLSPASPAPQKILTVPAFSVPLEKYVSQLAFSADGSMFATLAEQLGGNVEVRAASTGKLLWTVPDCPWPATLAFREMPPRLLVVNKDPSAVSEWDLATHAQISKTRGYDRASEGFGEAQSFDHTRTRLGAVSTTMAGVFDLRAGKTLWRQFSHFGKPGTLERGLEKVALSPDGRLLAAATRGPTVTIFEASSGEILRKIDGHAGVVLGLAFAHDGNTLVTTTSEHLVSVWDAASGLLRRRFAYPIAGGALAFSADGRALAIASEDRRAREYRVGVFASDTWELR